MFKLKNRIKVGTHLNKELYQKLQELSENSHIPMTRLLDEAIELLLKTR